MNREYMQRKRSADGDFSRFVDIWQKPEWKLEDTRTFRLPVDAGV